MLDLLECLEQARKTVCRIPAFACVMSKDRQEGGPGLALRASQMLAAFIGPYGPKKKEGEAPGLAYSLRLPGPDQMLTTWSFYEDSLGLCITEGEFYAEAFGRRPAIGEDRQLAKSLLDRVLSQGYEGLEELSGAFSGIVYSAQDHRLWAFVDQTGTRMLYVRECDDRFEIATNIYGFAGGGTTLELDAVGVCEHLAFGCPLQNRTVLKGVQLVPPFTAVECDKRGARRGRYYRIPHRDERADDKEVAESICQAVESQVRHVSQTEARLSVALSGGKDCRLAVAGLLEVGLLPEAFTFAAKPNCTDAAIAQRVAEKAHMPCHVLELWMCSSEQAAALSYDAAIMSDGFAAGFAFMVLSAVAGDRSDGILTGFTGDGLSGSWSGVYPWKASGIDDLAERVRRAAGYVIPPGRIARYLLPDMVVPQEQLIDNWRRGFRDEYERSGDLLTTHILSRLQLRNRRWGATFFNAMRANLSVVHPICAKAVLDAYMSMPPRYYRGQRAHILAIGHRRRWLTDMRTNFGKPFPCRMEPRLLPLIQAFRRGRTMMRNIRSAIKPPPEPVAMPGAQLSPRNESFQKIVLDSPWIKTDLMREHFPWLVKNANIHAHKFACAAIHVACALGRGGDCVDRSLFLRRAKS